MWIEIVTAVIAGTASGAATGFVAGRQAARSEIKSEAGRDSGAASTSGDNSPAATILGSGNMNAAGDITTVTQSERARLHFALEGTRQRASVVLKNTGNIVATDVTVTIDPDTPQGSYTTIFIKSPMYFRTIGPQSAMQVAKVVTALGAAKRQPREFTAQWHDETGGPYTVDDRM